MNNDDVLKNMIEVKLVEPDDFLKVKETLTRIGVASKKEKTLYQSCHILHKQGRYFICHFKQMFMLDGKKSDFSDDDISRLNTIANLLHDWELIDLIDENKSKSPVAALSQIKILTHKEKEAWKLVTKYNIGKKRRED
jgi:hypothetical protein